MCTLWGISKSCAHCGALVRHVHIHCGGISKACAHCGGISKACAHCGGISKACAHCGGISKACAHSLWGH